MAEFEFQYRWSEVASDWTTAVDKLEARDQALEQFISDFPCGSATASITSWLRINGAFSGPADAAEYTFSGEGNLTSFYVEAFGGLGPFMATFTIFVNGVSFLTTGSVTDGASFLFSEPVVAGDIVRVEGTATLGTITSCLTNLNTDGTDPQVSIGWDA